MGIFVKSISEKFGGNGGTNFDDLKDIINNSVFGSGVNIKKIDIKRIDIRSGEAIDYLRFSYNVETNDGVSHDYQGHEYGGNGGEKQELDLGNDERIIEIRGRSGGGPKVITYLEFQTSARTIQFGKKDFPGSEEFTMPVGVIFGSGGDKVDNIGAYEIIEAATQPAVTVTATVTPTIFPSSSSNLCSSSPIVIGLSTTTVFLFSLI